MEAEVIIVSLTTSMLPDLPRYVDFPCLKKRGNSARCRARTLAQAVANPKLFDQDAEAGEYLPSVNKAVRLTAIASGGIDG